VVQACGAKPCAFLAIIVFPNENMSFVRDTYIRKYYGPTMNAFEAAEKNGRASDLQKELEDLFNSQNKSPNKDATSIPATFLRVTAAVN
jgi:hypothetical protein